MSDKMRGALFNILGDIEGLHVLDAFAGTGALSFEAVNRGASTSLAIEQDKTAQRTLLANSKALGLGQSVKLISASVSAWLQTSKGNDFDLILCDPPYHDLQNSLIIRLADRVGVQGVLVLSWPEGAELPDLPDCELLDHRNYGDGSLAFYRKIK